MTNVDSIRELFGKYVPVEKSFDKHILKEYIQFETLDFLARHKFNEKLVFIGGTALRIAYNIDRFSEDLDFDCKEFSKDEFMVLTNDVVRFLANNGYDVATNDRPNPRLKAFRRNILFPKLLYDEGLSPYPEERFLLKIEAEDQGVDYPIEKRIISRSGFYFPISLPTVDVLCAMKVSAFLNRAKGRDIYDLMFLLGQTKPNISYLDQKMGIRSEHEVWEAIREKLSQIDVEHKSKDFTHLLFNKSNANKVFFFSEMVELELHSLDKENVTKKIAHKKKGKSHRL